MGRPPAHNPSRDLDLVAFNAEIQDALNSGLTVPCRSLPVNVSSAWTEATDDDARAATLAALLCAPCPVIQQCREYGLTHVSETGVFGGLTDTQRRPRRGRPRKAAGAA